MRRASWRPFQNLRPRTALRCGSTAGSMWFNQMGTTSKNPTVRMTKNSTNAELWTQVGYFSDTPRMYVSATKVFFVMKIILEIAAYREAATIIQSPVYIMMINWYISTEDLYGRSLRKTTTQHDTLETCRYKDLCHVQSQPRSLIRSEFQYNGISFISQSILCDRKEIKHIKGVSKPLTTNCLRTSLGESYIQSYKQSCNQSCEFTAERLTSSAKSLALIFIRSFASLGKSLG